MTQSKNHRWWLYIPWAAFILAAIAWCVYWFILAGEVEKRIEAFAAAHTEAGGAAAIGAIERHGFPVLLHFELRDVDFAPKDRAWRAGTSDVALHVNLTNPREFWLERQAPIAIQHGEDRSTLDADAMVLSLRFGDDALRYAGLEADRLRLDDPSADGAFTVEKIVVNARPDPRNAEEDWQIAVLIDAMHLARPAKAFEDLGQDIAHLQAAIVRTADARGRVEAAEFSWGELSASATGEIGLDEQRRLQGRLELIAPREALRLLPSPMRAAILLHRPTQDPLPLALEAADGRLKLEGRAVRDLAPLY